MPYAAYRVRNSSVRVSALPPPMVASPCVPFVSAPAPKFDANKCRSRIGTVLSAGQATHPLVYGLILGCQCQTVFKKGYPKGEVSCPFWGVCRRVIGLVTHLRFV